jgi:prepilin-type N-terminal cleavage/methylation domain-containing protein
MQGRQQSFTLIEMLIVIMIITILMALLSPALMQAKSTAKRVTCASNIKQFAVCYFLYRADSVDQWLPRSGLDNSDRMGYDLQHFEDGIASAMEGYGVSVELSTCPANPTIPRGWETVAGEQIFFLDHYSSYSYLDGEFHPVYGKEMDVGDSATHIPRPSQADSHTAEAGSVAQYGGAGRDLRRLFTVRSGDRFRPPRISPPA